MKSVKALVMDAPGAVKRRASVLSVGVIAAVASVAASAQTAGTPLFSDTAILSSINGVVPVVIDIGGAVLAVVTVAWGFKTVRGFLGR